MGYIVGIAKIEHTDKGGNPRYVVTNLTGDRQLLYDKIYCARGEMKNRIIDVMVPYACRALKNPVKAMGRPNHQKIAIARRKSHPACQLNS